MAWISHRTEFAPHGKCINQPVNQPFVSIWCETNNTQLTTLHIPAAAAAAQLLISLFPLRCLSFPRDDEQDTKAFPCHICLHTILWLKLWEIDFPRYSYIFRWSFASLFRTQISTPSPQVQNAFCLPRSKWVSERERVRANEKEEAISRRWNLKTSFFAPSQTPTLPLSNNHFPQTKGISSRENAQHSSAISSIAFLFAFLAITRLTHLLVSWCSGAHTRRD